jgi:hypothetical protein
MKACKSKFKVLKPNKMKSFSKLGAIVAGKASLSINNQTIGHQWFKMTTKPINVTMKYGMSDDSPFLNPNTITHPSTRFNIKEAGSKNL